MKRLVVFISLLLISNCTLGQSKEEIIKQANTFQLTIKENSQSYTKITVDNSDESTEGTQKTAYYQDNEIKLIEVIWYGETRKEILEFYVDNNRLTFAFNQIFTYNRPIYWDKQKAAEFDDSEVFDHNKTKVNTDRYYFKDEKLFLWLNNNGKEEDLNLGTNSLISNHLEAYFYTVKEELKK